MFPAEVNAAVRIIYLKFVLNGMRINGRYIIIFMYNQQLGNRKDVLLR